MKNVPCRFGCWNTWSAVGGVAGGSASLGTGFGTRRARLFPSSLSVFVVEAVISQLPAPIAVPAACCKDLRHHELLPLRTHNPLQSHSCFLKLLSVSVYSRSSRRVTDTNGLSGFTV